MSGDRTAGSVRVNLTIPAELDSVLVELAAHTGRGKAAFAVDALTWYFPRLQELLVGLRVGSRRSGGEVVAAGDGVGTPEGRVEAAERVLGVKLARDERKRLVRAMRAIDAVRAQDRPAG